MDQKLDIATAFDIGLDDASEQKFQALKNLHAKKIKLLMASVDSSQKEITKLKALSKDNMRTQMIQALRKKIRDIELVVDVLKQEFQSRADMSAVEVNEFVMRKTLGGPKRFRPLTREELEARITELEKKVEVAEKRLAKKAAGDGAVSATPRPSARATGAGTGASGSSLAAADLTRFAQTEVELDELQSTLASKNNLVMKYKEELVRLRARNNELLAAEEDCEIVELQNDELKAELRTAREEIDQLNRQMVSYHEEFIQHKNDSNMETELKFIDNENLQEQCTKLLKYNASLLKRMAELEAELEQAQASGSGGGSGNGDGRSHAALEGKVAKLQSKLKAAEDKLKTSTTGGHVSSSASAGEVITLKDTLREKNETIRELTKQLAHAHAGKDKGAAAVGSPAGKDPKDQKQQQMLQQQVVDLQKQLAESAAENRSLREANGALREEVEDLTAELAMFNAPEGDEGDEGKEEDGM
jgi:chromosome segregation ATPase